MSNISVRKMRVFLSAIEHNSFTKASVAQNISQPAATITINQIEEEFQCELFERQGSIRRAVPTPAGKKVADTFSRIIASYDGELASFSATSAGARRQRRILIQTNYDLCLDQKWLATLLQHYADDDLSIEVKPRDEIVDAVSQRQATLGLIDGNVEGQSLDYAPLGVMELVVGVPSNNNIVRAGSSEVSWADLSEEVVLFSSINPTLRRQVQSKIKALGSAAPRVTTCDSSAALISLLRSGSRTAIIPDAMKSIFSTWTDWQFVAFNDVTFSGQFGLVTPWGRLNRIPGEITRVRSCFTSEANTEEIERAV